MDEHEMTTITVEATVYQPVEKTWELWTMPEHITQWNFASDDWHCPQAENNLKPGGHFSWRMEAKDGSMGFDFSGTYDQVKQQQHIESTLDDGRMVSIDFTGDGNATRITETFEAEDVNTIELQRQGWQAILNNFKMYAEMK